MRRVIILTGTSYRHQFFGSFLASSKDLEVIKIYTEEVANANAYAASSAANDSNILRWHFSMRERSEREYFEAKLLGYTNAINITRLERGQINSDKVIDEIIGLNPDLIISFGCSIIKGRLLTIFSGRFINVHLGLSPHYRGSGTNIWPLINSEPQYIGATFMHIDSGIDTGSIIHQIQADIRFQDSPHDIGNRLIEKMSRSCEVLVVRFAELTTMRQPKPKEGGRLYLRKDFTEEMCCRLYDNLARGLLAEYLANYECMKKTADLVENPTLDWQ